MAATYVNNVTYIEDGYGEVQVRFVVSDSYSGLFLADSDAGATQCGCIEIESIKKGLENGVQATDEVSFSVNAAAIIEDADAACLSFLLDAQDVSTKRFVAVFINPTTTPTNTYLDFAGVLAPEQDAKDRFWTSSQYSSTITPLRDWKFVAKPFQIDFFNNFEIEDLVCNTSQGKPTGFTDGLLHTGSTWYDDNVADRLGYFKDGDKEVRWSELVDLNQVLLDLTAVVQGRLRTQLGEPTYTVTIVEGTSPYLYYPARWQSLQFPDVYSGRARYCGNEQMHLDSGGTMSFDADFFRILDGDHRYVVVGSTAADASPWVHWKLFRPLTSSKPLSTWDKCKTYTSLLYQIAYCFGFHLTFRYPSLTELEIVFVPLSDFVESQIYLPDALDASVKVNPIKGTPSNSLLRSQNNSSMYSLEGSRPTPDVYYWKMETYDEVGVPIRSWRLTNNTTTGNQLLLSISPTVRRQNFGEDGSVEMFNTHWRNTSRMFYLPHNAVFYDGSAIKEGSDGWKHEAYGALYESDSHIHTGIYLKLTGRHIGTGTISGDDLVEYGVSGLDIWSPVALMYFDGNQYDKLSDIANRINGVDSQARYESKYTLNIPYLCRFSTSDAGSDDDWRNLKVGSKIILDTIEYVVTSIERNIRSRQTKLELYNASKFSFTTSSGITTPQGVSGIAEGSGGGGSSVPTETTGVYVSADYISPGDATVQLDDNLIYRAQPIAAHLGRINGVALTAATPTSIVSIALPGKVVSSTNFPTLAVGKSVYLTNAPYPACNISKSPNAGTNPSYPFFAEIGFAIATDTIIVALLEEFIYSLEECS